MIGRLTGKLVDKQPPFLVIEVNGLGYEVEAPMSTVFQLGDRGGQVTVHTHLVVRDDAHLLYAFATLQERQLFRALIRVNGVGPKLALVILSGMGASEFWRAVRENDTAQLIRLPGVGKKTAERLVIEMRDRADAEPLSVGAPARPGSALDEARSALISLGYKPAEAQKFTDAVHTEDMEAEQIIREALRRAAR